MCWTALTDTLGSNVLPVPHVALAAVARECGNAASVQAQVGEMLAHVDGVVHGDGAWGHTKRQKVSKNMAGEQIWRPDFLG